jgi:hypothetical protein
VTVPLEAPQDSEIEVLVVPVTVGLPGVPGAPGFVGPPEQLAPLNVQFSTPPVKLPGLPLKPNVALAPAGRVGAQPGLVNVWRCPLLVRTASQDAVMLYPAGRSKTTVQPFIALVVPLTSVNLPSNPPPQSETLVKVAVAGAALAGTGTMASAPSAAIRHR